MLQRCPILIVEDEPIIAMSLAMEIEFLNGVVVGPTSTVAQALNIVRATTIGGAILDGNLADRTITPVAIYLWERQIPFVLHSAKDIPSELASAISGVPVVPKPADPAAVIAELWKRCQARG